MGTSNSNKGQKGSTPLVPSWLDDDQESNPIPPEADSDRFRVPRGDFTRYINSSGHSSGNLHKALSGYIRNSLGGSKNAVLRLGAARSSSNKLITVLSGISKDGLSNTLEKYGLGNLVGKPLNQILWGLIDYLSPDGGSTDEGIARSSLIETLTKIEDMGISDLDKMGEEQFIVLIELYFTNVIMERLINDIGDKTINLPENINTVEVIENQIGSIIQGTVSDAIKNMNINIRDITPNDVSGLVDKVYETSYKILGSLYNGG